MKKSREKLGQILLKEGLVTEEQMEKAINIQQKEGTRLGETLINLGIVTEKDIVIAMAKQLSIPYASYAKGLLKPAENQDLAKLVPEDYARRNMLLPISKHMSSMTVAFMDPLDLITIDNLKRMTNCDINPIIATKTDLQRAIDEFYGKEDLLKDAISDSYELEEFKIEKNAEEDLSLDDLIASAEEAPVVKLVDLILMQAIKDRASDIHIEPFKNKINIRYRIDGVLYEIPPPARHLLPAIVSRIKILSNLDIAERRLPQDGVFFVKVDNKGIDIRVSTIPAIFGEKVVLRILDKSATPLNLGDLGFDPEELEKFRRAINSPHGLILITGPTGSGKTTTLYAALNEIKSPRKNISTVEDPVEYKLEGINQVQIKTNIGFTFAGALRAFLRQDPDIIMVGEVRDMETAQICIRASLTGHLVLSTLHTNDAPSAISRLIDIGLEPYLISSSLIMVGAQRLVRRLCPECKEAYETTPALAKDLGIKQELLYKPKGCDYCSHTGYRGRVAIYEIVLMNDKLRELIARGASLGEIKDKIKELGLKTLLKSGLKKAEEGITSVEEVLSITLVAGEE
ncbi:MAG: type II secretion system protein GspE [Candidatus Omnitrophica bacterium CG_4_9_14_0_2_um_filter_42_8]|nr:MAG: type II secretion system protein GspE [Candidatus Omnitrophica bacterium CG_4_9_14_0_2_um_filter_42_8]